MKYRLIFLLCIVFAGACGGSSGGLAVNAIVPDECTITQQNQFVDDVMRDIYYWVDELPASNPASFESPEALLEFLRFPDLDRFSGIADAAEEDAFFSNSQFIGVGIGTKLVGDDQLRVTQTFSDGPARAVGIDRGYTLLEINGLTIAEALAADGISAAFGADAIGTQVDLRYTDLAGTEMEVTIFKALVTIDTVSASAVFDVGGAQTGYLQFRNFVEPSFDALANTFADLSQAGVSELVLDLRYNGGGLISVAEYLSGLLGGEVTAGQLFARRVHNTQNARRNVDTPFIDELNALDLDRIVIITSGGTASASELIINGLDPFLDVWLVGSDTFGKPVGSYGFPFCDKVLRPISFANENAVGNKDFFAGFPVDCASQDDLEHALGDPQESSLAEALYVIENSACSPVSRLSKTDKPDAAKTRPARSYNVMQDIY